MQSPTRLVYVSPAGQQFGLIGTGRATEVYAEADTLDGLVGTFEDTQLQLAGVPGARIDFRDRVIPPLEGSFTVVARSVQAWREFRRAWSTRTPGTLELFVDDRQAIPATLQVRLSAPLPFPATVPRTGARIPVGIIADGGLWNQPEQTGHGTVTITNTGDVTLWPAITAGPTGGTVTLPSGAGFTLQPGNTVDFAGGTVTMRASAADTTPPPAPPGAVAEGVPPGQARTYTAAADATITWSMKVLDPWT